MKPENIGDVLMALRLSKGWTQTDLAKRAHVSRAVISYIENGHSLKARNLEIMTLIKLFGTFGVGIEINLIPNGKVGA